MDYALNVAADFCNRWLQRAEEVGDGADWTLNPAIDEFFSVYVAYNVLYTFVGDKLEPGQLRDRHRAVALFPQHVGYDAVLTFVHNAPTGLSDLASLPTLIAPKGQFLLHHGKKSLEPNPDRDAQTVQKLMSQGSKRKVEGLLEYIYQVRCNVFHGTKMLIDNQTAILRPCSRILRSIVVGGRAHLLSAG